MPPHASMTEVAYPEARASHVVASNGYSTDPSSESRYSTVPRIAPCHVLTTSQEPNDANAIKEHQHVPRVADSLTNSQESYISNLSTSGPQLLSSSSNVDSGSAADTELSSPYSSQAPNGQSNVAPENFSKPTAPSELSIDQTRPFTPPVTVPLRSSNGSSPMSIDTKAATQGSKRTASGTVKANVAGPTSPSKTAHMGHSRTTSMESNASRISDVCNKPVPSTLSTNRTCSSPRV